MAERILLFVPMYNCAPQIPRVLDQLDERVRAVFDTVIVVDNRSTDGSVDAATPKIEALTGIRAAVLRNDENYGLGGSHKVAFAYAIEHGFDWLVVLHGDDQGDVHDLVGRIEQGEHRPLDALLGSRFHRDSRLQGYSAFRTFGNRVFNALFSVAVGRWLTELGSGLNLYRVGLLKDGFYLKFPDDLTFNYLMTLAHAFYGHRTAFFPIVWREEDQISNVKLFSQARRVLGLLARFFVGRGRMLALEHRATPRERYTAQVVASNEAYQAAEEVP